MTTGHFCYQRSRFGRGRRALALLMLLLIVSCKKKPETDHAGNDAMKQTGNDPVLVGAADVASCDDLAGAEATAKLLDRIPGTVFVAGDLAYPDGSDADFANCYAPTWGRHRARTRP